MAAPIYLSIVIPAFNERQRLPATLFRIETYLSAQSWAAEIIVVDDGSTDGTKEFVATIFNAPHRTFIRLERNRGKGAAVRAGVMKAQGEFILISDADLSTPIEELDKFLLLMALSNSHQPRVKIVTGSRRLKGAELMVRQPFLREFSGRVFSLLVRLFVVGGFLDTQCGFKLLESVAGKEVFRRTTVDGFGFDVEMIYIAQQVLGFRVLESPVRWADSAATKVNLLRDASRMFADIFVIRFNGWRGIYRL